MAVGTPGPGRRPGRFLPTRHPTPTASP
jgi:hypothetical protein